MEKTFSALFPIHKIWVQKEDSEQLESVSLTPASRMQYVPSYWQLPGCYADEHELGVFQIVVFLYIEGKGLAGDCSGFIRRFLGNPSMQEAGLLGRNPGGGGC